MERLRSYGLGALLLLFSPLILLWLCAYVTATGLWGAVLRVWFGRAHAADGRRVMFVYSESPNWQDYIERNILPRLEDQTVVLNWSQRRQWTSATPWEERFFRHFAGDHEFNPIALVFGPRGRVRRVRFHQAFIDHNHGDNAALEAAESELFSLI